MSRVCSSTGFLPSRFTAWTVASVYILVLLGTFLHLGMHDHIYSPRLNAFVHPLAGSNSDGSHSPINDSRNTPDPQDHSLHFTIGDEAPAIFSVEVTTAVHRVVQRPRIHEATQRSIYHVAPKHSPPIS